MTIRFIVLAAVVMACAGSSFAQQQFDTPDAASQALIEAAGAHDTARLTAILGPAAQQILTSGHVNQDQAEQIEFARLARERHRLEISPINPNRAVLAIGDEDWPFPVPIRCINGKWSFDASETPVEMRARHIGTDELDAIEICHGYVEAQEKYASEDRDRDGMLEYAPHLMSTTGRHDGLYWDSENGPLIPAGLARAEWIGPRQEATKPYHGYYFRILDGQGSNALGGSHNYLVKNKLIGGFGLVAWPAEYGVTGIHTFMVNQDDLVYQKDITPVPGRPAKPITKFDPDPSWEPAQ